MCFVVRSELFTKNHVRPFPYFAAVLSASQIQDKYDLFGNLEKGLQLKKSQKSFLKCITFIIEGRITAGTGQLFKGRHFYCNN